MSTELINELEFEIRELYNQVVGDVESCKKMVVSTATAGANLGEYIQQWAHETRAASPEEAWNKLRALDPSFREDIFRFARRAMQARKRGQLDDPAQLQFLLADSDGRSNSEPKATTNEVMHVVSQCTKVRSYITGWTSREPVEKWNDTVKQAVREQLKPLAELYAQLNQ